ncbi:MAG: ABC-F family ATP-binding cassette domain-containing protein [Ruminococcus sp.]|nr:ABC-F family ATP-binding cassette domain-containing protein [Ruminococcus sp.]
MPVLSVHNLSKSFVEQKLFKDVSFDVEKGDKVGFIGANGVGKTTLFRILNGEVSPDEGSIFKSGDVTIGYMQQHACTHPERSVHDELISVFDYLIDMEAEITRLNALVAKSATPENIEKQTALIERFESLGGLTYKSRTRSALIGFGFEQKQFDMPTGKLSGGQRSKLSLLKLLLSRSDFLLLDEPTNHLDISSVNWLESFIKGFKGSMLIISHDRYFLDKVTNKTIELEHNSIMMYKGNYTEFKKKKQAYEDSLRNKYENDLKEIKRIEGIVEQQKRWGRERNFITAASKQKQADRIKAQLVAPEKELETVNMRLEPKRESGNDVLMATDLSKSFGEKTLFKNVSFHLRKGEKVFVLGDNGCGKTTLFNILMGKLSFDSGFYEYGAQVDIGYFDQMQTNLDLNKSALDEIWDAFPDMTETRVRTYLGSFLFRGDEVFKPLNQMSGGERARVSLLKLMLNGSNLLLLDEPTNHLDASSREQLEQTLSDYEGTMLIISHDRYFINKLADRVLVLTKNGMVQYLGNYDYYAEKISMVEKALDEQKHRTEKKPNTYELEKQRRAKERKRLNDIKKAEELINSLDEQIEELNKLLSNDEVISDYEKLLELTADLESKESELEKAYEELDELNW